MSKAVNITILKTGRPFWEIDFAEIWRYRYMFMYLVRRDIVLLYKQTVLGPVWVILQPFLMSFLFSIIFGSIAGIRTDGIPGFLFYFSNNVFWYFLSQTYTQISTVYQSGKALMGKVYFPRLIVPLATLGGSAFKLGIQLVFLVGLIVFYLVQGKVDIQLGVGTLLIPFAVVQLGMIAVGTGFIFAWSTLKYRDLAVVGNLFIQGWMYLSPVAYPMSEVPVGLAKIMAFNPVTSALEMIRHGLYGTPLPSNFVVVSGLATTAILFLVGVFNFNVVQRRFIDIV